MIMHQLDARMRKMLSELWKMTSRRSVPIQNAEWTERGKDQWQAMPFGATWGEQNPWIDFRAQIAVPEDFTDQVTVKLRTGCESGWDAINPQFVVRVDGVVRQAFDVNHRELVLMEKAVPGTRFELVLNGYSNQVALGMPLPVLELTLSDENAQFVQLIHDMRLPYEAAILLPEDNREREETLEAVNRALDILDIRNPHSPAFDESVAAARAYLKTEYYDRRRSLAPIAYADAIGHTHIDVAWQWDLYQSRHKAVRSFATVLELMRRYPEYRFMSSQPVLYQFVQQDEPEEFERIRQAVKDGRWQPEGGMWVEADCNVTSGESLARQLLHGQEYFMREFGERSRILWLPDVFGYSAALPQLMKLADIDYFMTTKLSWNEYNLVPYDTFMWKGLDGTEVLTHFSPSRDFNRKEYDGLSHFTTYNSFLNPSQMAGAWQRFQQKGVDDHFLVSYGWGDGGGGSTPEMLENARRMDVPLPGIPKVSQVMPRDFFTALEKRVAGRPDLPKWSGELYLEYHRGTYTAMARNKRSNRKMELLLRDVELWRAYAQREVGLPYPAKELHEIWENVLTLQFHDILPGSSIKKVYDDSKEIYDRIMPQAQALKQEALCALARRVEGDVAVFNSLTHEREDVVFFDAPEAVRSLRAADGTLYPVQFVEGKACAFVKHLAPLTATPFWFSDEAVPCADVTASLKGFDTPFFTGAFDKTMRLVSLVEKQTGREVARSGEALNRIVCYENRPHNYDAWDVNIYYSRKHWDVDDLKHAEVIAAGPVLALIRVTYAYQKSTVSQDILIYNGLPRIDWRTTVDWKEKQYLLKAHFPVDVFYNDATFDVQYGNIRRATHKNTSWDVARFEVCAHKWVDVAEDGFGVALMNDCKYGHSVDERGVALTLLKSSVEPNPEADIEVHHFTYSLMPHAGSWREAQVPRQAYQLNVPLDGVAASGEKTGLLPAFAQVENAESVMIEVVKEALDGQGDVIRLYECFGRRVKGVKVRLSKAYAQAQVVNILEEKLSDADYANDTLTFDLRPYEIKTFRLIP